MESPDFLKDYKVHEKPEAIAAAKKKERLENRDDIVHDRAERIQAYMERLEHVFLNPDARVRERNIALLKPKIHDNALIKKENFPESYFAFQQRQAKERGMGDVSFSDAEKEQEIARVIESQRASLDAWINYLTSDDCAYPPDIKYFAMQGIIRSGTFDTATYSFTKREKSTVAPFAEIDREVLSMVLGALDARHHAKPTESYSPELLSLIDRKKNFDDLYAAAMRELDQKADKQSLLPVTAGEWRMFEKGSDPRALADSLTGTRSNLCIADLGSAEAYLAKGSVEIYFSRNRTGQPAVPRLAVACEPAGVYEVRGTWNKNEDVDPYIAQTSILSEKLARLPHGEAFSKKDASMKKMTAIYNTCFKIDRQTGEKTYLNPSLSADELRFLYEIDAPIEGFGYEKDPRVEEIRSRRDATADAPVILDCRPEDIAQRPEDVKETTKAYIGQLFRGIFQKNIEHIFTSFPEGKIRSYHVEIGGGSKEQLERELKEKNIVVDDWAKYLMNSRDFTVSKTVEPADLIRLTVEDLGFQNGATIDEIYKKAEEFGLELCPAQVGPTLRLSYSGSDWMYIAMKQISGRGGRPVVFLLSHGVAGLELLAHDAKPSRRWVADDRFVFRLRKKL